MQKFLFRLSLLKYDCYYRTDQTLNSIVILVPLSFLMLIRALISSLNPL